MALCHLTGHLEALSVDLLLATTATFWLVSESLLELINLLGATFVLSPVVLDQLVQADVALSGLQSGRLVRLGASLGRHLLFGS